MRDSARTVSTLGLLALALPANAALTAVALARAALRRRPEAHADRPRTVMISGGKMTKALALARAFHRAGHRVVLVEAHKYRLTGHRFSRAVDAFHTVPPPEAPGYAAALVDVARREDVDLYVPVCSPVSSLCDAEAKEALSQVCEVLHPDPDTVRSLDDKHAFTETATALGLRMPDALRVTDPAQVADFDFGDRTYVLKSIRYDPIRRLDLTPLPRPTRAETEAFVRGLPISPDNPWILQEFVEGQEYCTHTTARDGRVLVHCCCESSPFQINYDGVEHPAIESWVRTFVGELGITGQVSFDFMEDADGRVYAIECNPRTHSAITMFHDHPGLADAYLGTGTGELTPLPGSRPTHWTYHELWRALTRPSQALRRARLVMRGKDAIFDWADPVPFLAVHHLQVPALLVENLRARRGWLRIDFNIGKLVEPAGD